MAAAVAATLALIAFGAIVRWARSRSREVHRLFGLDPRTWHLVACDIGGHQKSGEALFHAGARIAGRPDALFRGPGGQWVVGEYKHRAYRGRVRARERYQVLLYMGIVREVHRTNQVRGLIRYRDRMIEIHWDEPLWRWLLRCAERYRAGAPPPPRPIG